MSKKAVECTILFLAVSMVPLYAAGYRKISEQKNLSQVSVTSLRRESVEISSPECKSLELESAEWNAESTPREPRVSDDSLLRTQEGCTISVPLIHRGVFYKINIRVDGRRTSKFLFVDDSGWAVEIRRSAYRCAQIEYLCEGNELTRIALEGVEP